MSRLSRFVSRIFTTTLVAHLSLSPAGAIAADNVLGLLVPRDARRPGAIVLHGGGRITSDVFERFVALAGGQQARILLVPCAGYHVGNYDSEEDFLAHMRRRFSSWVELAATRQIRSFDFLYSDDPDDADDTEFVRPLTTATGVWFCGGWQERLNYRFVGEFPEQTRFQVALRGVVERGGVVGGTSAGMAALPEIITLRGDYEEDECPLAAVAAHGLGLLRGAIVEQHFDTRGGRLERFMGLLRGSEQLDELARRDDAGAKMVGLAVDEPAALVLQGDRLQTLGAGSAHVYLKSLDNRMITWHELPAGDVAELRRDMRGAAVLRRLPRASPP